jgi:hypothetical protein
MATNPWVTLITASLGGLLTLVGVVITQRHTSHREDVRWTREDTARSTERKQQRLADSYLEVLRLVEREAQWFEASTKNYGINVVNHDHQLGLQTVELPERTITDRSTIAAHVAAYGSKNVRTLHQTWRSTITAIEDAHHSWNEDWIVNEPPSSGEVEHVRTMLHPRNSLRGKRWRMPSPRT